MNSKTILAAAAALTAAAVALPAGATVSSTTTTTTTVKTPPVYFTTNKATFDAVRKGYSDLSFSFKQGTVSLPNPYTQNGVTFAADNLYGVGYKTKTGSTGSYLKTTGDLTVSYNGPVLGLTLVSLDRNELLSLTVNGIKQSVMLTAGVSTFVGFDNFGASNSIKAVFDVASCGGTIEVLGFQTAVPEAATWAMMMVGLGVVGGSLRRRRGKVSTRVAFA